MPADSGNDLVAYDLGEADGDAVLEMLEDLLAKEVKNKTVQLSLLPSNNQILAIARPKQQEAISKALEQVRVEDRELEVFQLNVVDPFSAQMAIESLFGSAAYDDFNAPFIESDSATQQLFIRGTPFQLEEIRDLLIKMGETQLGRSSSRVSSGNLRVVPFPGDTRSAIDEIQRIWPQLRGNEIRVVTPSEPLRSVQPQPTERPTTSPPATPKQDVPPAAPKPNQSSGTSRARFDQIGTRDMNCCEVGPASRAGPRIANNPDIRLSVRAGASDTSGRAVPLGSRDLLQSRIEQQGGFLFCSLAAEEQVADGQVPEQPATAPQASAAPTEPATVEAPDPAASPESAAAREDAPAAPANQKPPQSRLPILLSFRR